MKLTHRLRNWLLPTRAPDRLIGGVDDTYLCRWFLIPRNPVFNIYLHNFLRSDDDRALHDHPWVSCSIILVGEYDEVVVDRQWRRRGATDPGHAARHNITEKIRRREGAITFRGARTSHRVLLLRDSAGREKDVWTLFITGPRIREWGFWCPQGWKHWKLFTAFAEDGDGSRVGPGCD